LAGSLPISGISQLELLVRSGLRRTKTGNRFVERGLCIQGRVIADARIATEATSVSPTKIVSTLSPAIARPTDSPTAATRLATIME
jgi:hypothetical protein